MNATKYKALWNVMKREGKRLVSRPLYLFCMVVAPLFCYVFFTTLMESPAEMSARLAPSFCACLTLEFIKTVHRLPRSTGARANSPSLAKSATGSPIQQAKVSRKEPHPEQHASMSQMPTKAPSRMVKH